MQQDAKHPPHKERARVLRVPQPVQTGGVRSGGACSRERTLRHVTGLKDRGGGAQAPGAWMRRCSEILEPSARSRCAITSTSLRGQEREREREHGFSWSVLPKMPRRASGPRRSARASPQHNDLLLLPLSVPW